jgi:hypothetical protein
MCQRVKNEWIGLTQQEPEQYASPVGSFEVWGSSTLEMAADIRGPDFTNFEPITRGLFDLVPSTACWILYAGCELKNISADCL